MCSAGGKRVLRHNAARNAMYHWAERAGLNSELERPVLPLPQRPGDCHLGMRHPADSFVPALGGVPFALVVTAPQRTDHLLALGAVGVRSAAAAYAHTDAAHLGTARQCAAQGVRFVSLVAETTGAWDPAAAAVKGSARVLPSVRAATSLPLTPSSA